MKAIFACLAAVFVGMVIGQQQRGIQVRLTQKGLDYTIQEAVKILEGDIRHKPIKDFSGRKSGFDFNGRNFRITNLNIGSRSLTPDYKLGLKATVADVSIGLSGQLKYSKKVGWFRIRDTVDINAQASSVSFSLSLSIGKTSDGHPDIGVNWCNPHVGSLRLHFSGSRASVRIFPNTSVSDPDVINAIWLYNLFASFIEGNLQGQLSDLMCKSARDSINKRGKEEMQEFQVKKKIDSWGILDYSLTAPPVFDYSYMDLYLKGEFLDKNKPTHHSSLHIPTFTSVVDNSKMIYFWLTDYTFNTAGETYHNAGFFSLEVTKKSDVSPFLKSFLNTNAFKALIPELTRRFPNRPMQVKVFSYKPPKAELKEGEIYLYIYGTALFQVVAKDGKLYDAFALTLDCKAGVAVSITEKEIKGKLQEFKFSMKVGKSNIGPINIPVQLPLIQSLVKTAIVRNAKRFLAHGFPLPNLDEVFFTNPQVKILEGVIRIGTDCKYVRKSP